MEEYCRICRKSGLFISFLINSTHDGIPISEMLKKTFPIDITSEDPISQLLPKSICNDCLEVVSAAYHLQRVCIESDQFFRSMITNDQIIVKNEKFEEEVEVKLEELIMAEEANDSESEMNFEEQSVTYLEPVTKKRKVEVTTFHPRLVLNPFKKSEPQYECNFCLLQFKPRQTIMKHMRQEHDPIILPFGCDYCAARFKGEDKKWLHENVRHPGETVSVILCEVCGVNGISEEGMRNHLIDDHKMSQEKMDIEMLKDFKRTDTVFKPRPFNKASKYEDVYYACNFCHSKQKPKKNLLRHMYTKHDPILLPFYCNYCDARFKDQSKQEAHELKHAKTDKKVIVCNICNATGIRDVGMEHHMEDDHGSTVKRVTHQKKYKSKIKMDANFNPRPLPGSESLEFDDVWYICHFCDKKMKPKMSMCRHMRVHSASAYPYGCEYCILRFEDKEEFEAHNKYLHENDVKSTLFCDICGASGDHKEGMENHMTDDHLGMSPDFSFEKRHETFKCRHCGSKFLQKRGLDNHLLSKHKELTKCDECDEEFDDRKKMSHHIMLVHSKKYRQLEPHEIEISYKCCKCEQDHATEKELDEHLQSHKNSFKIEKTKCHFCPKNIKIFSEFVAHAKYHALPHTHECLTCKKRLPFGGKLLSHVKNHKRYDNYKVECRKCLQKFRSAKDLDVHDKVKHNKETLFICPICAKSLSSANGLDQHIRYVHHAEEEKKFECKFCPMKFILKTKLTRHEAVHSSVRPHVCEICGNSFKHPEGLRLHMKRHNGTLIKKHECKQCSHKFTSKHRLEQHMMTHTGLKPHECKFCDRAYASKGDLVKHMQKLHVGDAIYQCEKCPKAFRLIVELREHQQEHGTGSHVQQVQIQQPRVQEGQQQYQNFV